MANNEKIKNSSIEMSIAKLTLYSILSLSFYTLIWFYKKWDFIRKNNIKKVNPLIRTLIMGLPILNFILPILLFKELFAYSIKWSKFKIILISIILSFIMCTCDALGRENVVPALKHGFDPANRYTIYVYISLLNFLPILIAQYCINSGMKEKLRNDR